MVADVFQAFFVLPPRLSVFHRVLNRMGKGGNSLPNLDRKGIGDPWEVKVVITITRPFSEISPPQEFPLSQLWRLMQMRRPIEQQSQLEISMRDVFTDKI